MSSLFRNTLKRQTWSSKRALSPSRPSVSRANCPPFLLRSSHSQNVCRRTLGQPTGVRKYSEFRQRNSVGVFTPASAAVFIITGVGLLYYFRYEKAKLLEEREKERESKTYGRPNLGGPFTLINGDEKPFSDKDMLGKWNLVYFGFTNCPDICPMELEKVTAVLDRVVKNQGPIFQPIFISVDPARDTPKRIKRYLEDFHPSYVGLVGSYDDTKAVCKQYRVYFSTPPNADPKGDYLVDHSIFVYLMDPEGKFVEAFGQSVLREEMIEKIGKSVAEWEAEKGNKT
ncbi:SCO1/SenC domain containing protein [Amanita muscaria]